LGCIVNNILSGGDDFDYQCHSNLVRAILPYGRTEFDVHDVLNVFQVTGLDKDGKYFMWVHTISIIWPSLPLFYSKKGRLLNLPLLNREACPAKPTDYFTFFAETDLLCALSTCPGGDLSVYGWGEDAAKRMLDTCRPLGVAVYEIEGKDEVLKEWKESEVSSYAGMHGLKTPVFGEGMTWETAQDG
jgi:uncharacterized protein YcgI (DUF1989 family)